MILFSTRLPVQRAFTLLLFVAAAVWPSASATADVSDPFLVEDLDPTRSSFRGATAVGLADTTILLGDRLWRTDGTAATTVELPLPADVNPTGQTWVTPDGAKAYFTASDGSGIDVFVTDGTAAGTRRLTTGGGIRSQTTSFTVFLSPTSGDLYFVRVLTPQQGGVEYELWVSDGTLAGTRSLAEYPDLPLLGVEVGGTVLFSAFDAERNRALFRTDGTRAGTFELSTVQAGFSSPAFVTLGDQAIFGGFEEDTGTELYITDGTAAGTRLLTDLTPGPAAAQWDLFVSGDLLYAVRSDGSEQTLVVTDGTAAGTRELVSFSVFDDALFRFPIRPFGDGRLFFQGISDDGLEPWVADAEGARPLKDLCPGDCSSEPRPLAALGDGLYFTADDGLTGTELYFTDGSTAGTKRVADLCAGPCSAVRGGWATVGDTLYFFGRDHNREREIYRTRDGNPPTAVTDFDAREPFSGLGLRAANGLVYFHLAEADGPALYATDGLPGGSRPVLSLDAELFARSSEPEAFGSLGEDLLVVAYDDQGPTLFRKTGDQPAEVLAVLSTTDGDGGGPEWARIHTAGNRAFVVTDLDSFEGDVSVTDGTPAGTTLLADDLSINGTWTLGERLVYHDGRANRLWAVDSTGARVALSRQVSPSTSFAMWNGQLLFSAEAALWKTDGTPGGTTRITDLAGFGGDALLSLHPAGSVFYFVGRHPASVGFNVRVFRSDGTDAGTSAATPEGLRVSQGVGVANGHLIFTGDRDGEGPLWSTDGTPDGTVLLMNSPLLTLLDRENQQAHLGSELWFLTETGFAVRTDGTPNGTSFASVWPAEDSAGQLFEIPGHLLYTRGSSRDRELWVTDGTESGTRLLRTFDFLDTDFHPHRDRVYFAADGGPTVDVGEELWAIRLLDAGPPPPPPPPPTGVPSAPRNLRAEGGASAVKLRWTDASSNESRFVVQARAWDSFEDWRTIHTVPANTTSVFVDLDIGYNPRAATAYRVRAENDDAVSDWSAPAAASPVRSSFDCQDDIAGPEVLCLQGGRFSVETYWRVDRDGDVQRGRGTARPFDFSDDSGTFWFFDPANVELVVKVLDARVVNGFFWNFYGALSNVEYWIVVTDVETNTNVTYYNPPDEICGQADVTGFPRPDFREFLRRETAPAASEIAAPATTLDQGQGACIPDTDTLCLTPDRYRVTVTWRDQRSGDTGVGHAIPGTSDSGYFWFFEPDNVELVVKVLDARTVNGFVWVFYGALTDVEYTLTVTDTQTGVTKEYFNPPGNICGDADVRAF